MFSTIIRIMRWVEILLFFRLIFICLLGGPTPNWLRPTENRRLSYPVKVVQARLSAQSFAFNFLLRWVIPMSIRFKKRFSVVTPFLRLLVTVKLPGMITPVGSVSMCKCSLIRPKISLAPKSEATYSKNLELSRFKKMKEITIAFMPLLPENSAKIMIPNISIISKKAIVSPWRT